MNPERLENASILVTSELPKCIEGLRACPALSFHHQVRKWFLTPFSCTKKETAMDVSEWQHSERDET